MIAEEAIVSMIIQDWLWCPCRRLGDNGTRSMFVMWRR